MGKEIGFVSCPVCRRRYPSVFMLRKWRADYSVIDYPVQIGTSLGHRGFSVKDYYSWKRLDELSAGVRESLYIFLRRLENTYLFLEELQLFSPDDYVPAYTSNDDLARAYRPGEVNWIGYK